MKRFLFVFAASAGLLLVLGTTGWLLRDTIALTVANTLLRDSNVRIHNMTALQPTRTDTRISELTAFVPDNGLLLTASDIRMTYSLAGLRRGQFTTVHIGRVDLQTANQKPTPITTGPALRLSDAMETVRDFPVRSAQIGELSMNSLPRSLRVSAQKQGGGLTASVTDGVTEASLDLNWHDQNFVSSHFLPTGGHPTTGLQQAVFPALPVTAELHLQTGAQHSVRVDLSAVADDNMFYLHASSHINSSDVHAILDALSGMVPLPAIDMPPVTGAAGISIQTRIPNALQVPVSMTLHIDLDAGGHVGIPDTMLTGYDTGDIQFQWDHPVEITWSRADPGADSTLELSGETLTLGTSHIGHAAGRLGDLTAKLANYRLQCSTAEQCQFFLSGDLHAGTASIAIAPQGSAGESLRLHEPSLSHLALDGTFRDNELNLQLASGLLLVLPEAEHPLLSAWNTEINLRSPARIRAPLSTINELHLQFDELHMALPLMRNDNGMAGIQLEVSDFDAMPLGTLSLSANLHLSNAYTNLFALNLWDAALTTDLSVENGTVEFDAMVTLNNRPSATVRGTHTLPGSRGEARMEIPDISFDDADNRLTAFISPLPVTADLLSGTISGSAHLQWNAATGSSFPTVQGSVDLMLRELGGYVGSIGFIDVDTRIHARLDENWQLLSVSDESIRIGRLDAGIALEDISANFGFSSAGPAVQLSQFELTVFGGHIRTDHLDHDASVTQNTTTLTLDGIDIAQVMSLSAYEGVSATGVVDGELPVTISATGFTVNQGWLRAREPGGSIAYRDGPTSTGNTSMDLVYRALGNYRYSRLEADVDYMDDGELLLAVRMEGIAPDVGDGQRINLNVNISDNIPNLLESLQAARNIAESVQENYRSR